MDARPRVILASASERRRSLLAAAGVEFEVAPADVDERLELFSEPVEASSFLARRKALFAAERELVLEPRSRALVIGADTVVAIFERERWSLLGKPADEDEARAMLRRLSGTRHAVVTGVCVVSCPELRVLEESERTWVRMREISTEEITAYVASGEWRDKAGGYAIQESADRFVTGIEEGGFDNVVGLPVRRTLELLDRARLG